MKKITFLFLTGMFLLPSLFSQPSCVSDVWMSLRNGKIPIAKKDIDACIIANPNNADVWLMRGSVYLHRYEQEQNLKRKTPSYVIKDVDAVWIANESFYKALSLDPKVEPKSGMFSAKAGQIACAQPLYFMGLDFFDQGNHDKAFEYLSTAARNFKLDERNPGLPLTLGYIYSDLAQISLLKNDFVGYKKMLQEGVNAKTPFPNIYLALYDTYKKEGDTVNAGKLINTAIRNIPDSLSIDIYGVQLDYYSMILDFDKLNATCDTITNKFGDNTPILVMIANYLNNAGQYEKAEEYIQRGLEKDPNSFDLNYQMAYRYFFEALSYQNRIDMAMNDMQYTKMQELQKEEKVVLESAHEWAEKAYQINQDDRQNNIMLNQLKMRLLKEIPAELKEKIESYRQ